MEINGKNTDSDMAEEINNFFADIGPGLADKIPDSVLHRDYSFTGNYDRFSFEEVTVDEVIKLLKNISVNKSNRIEKWI